MCCSFIINLLYLKYMISIGALFLDQKKKENYSREEMETNKEGHLFYSEFITRKLKIN
jgi:hypothetical protein